MCKAVVQKKTVVVLFSVCYRSLHQSQGNALSMMYRHILKCMRQIDITDIIIIRLKLIRPILTKMITNIFFHFSEYNSSLRGKFLLSWLSFGQDSLNLFASFAGQFYLVSRLGKGSSGRNTTEETKSVQHMHSNTGIETDRSNCREMKEEHNMLCMKF